jgi:methionyl-tRNA formyltransferase
VRILFLGTPEFAVPTLKELIDDPRFEVVGAVMQPDRPSGRGNKMQEPPTKVLAKQHNVPVFQPTSLSKSPEIVDQLRALAPDYVAMVAFGQILRKSMLELPKKGVINIHASLLPKYRGAAPINWAIINGETVSGVTTMFTEAGVDTGPMLLKSEVSIGPDMTAEELASQLSTIGAKLLIESIVKLESGELLATPQNDLEASLAPMMNKELGKIDWSLPAKTIHNLVRGLCPWPGTYTSFREAPLKILKTKPAETAAAQEPGTVKFENSRLLIACGADGSDRLEVLEAQPANKGRMAARDWANGAHLTTTDKLGC